MRVEQYLPAVGSRLRKIAAQSAPREACGILTRSRELVELPNRHPTPDSAFDAGALHELERREGELLAIFHTHPGDEPPSPQDVVQCCASFHPWVIAGPSQLWVLYPEAKPYSQREFLYGSDDCWQLVSDWHAQEAAIRLPWFERPPDGWWHVAGQSPYLEAAERYGFMVAPMQEWDLEDLRLGDVILMKVAARQTNHAALYIGNGCMLHHLYGELSRIELYSPAHQRLTTHVARHRELARRC